MPTRRIRVLVAALATVIAASAPAQAQPTCSVGTLADYVALVGGCRLGGLTFTGFVGDLAGVDVTPPRRDVTLTPVAAGGQAGFGVTIAPALGASLATTPRFAFERLNVRFSVAGVGAGGSLGFAPISLFTSFVDAAGATGMADALVVLSVRSTSGGDEVRAASEKRAGLPGTFGCAVEVALVPCGPYVSTSFGGGQVDLSGEAMVSGAPGTSATASLPNLSVLVGAGVAPPVTAVPEPASVLLLGGGLAGLGLAGARRRRRSARPPVGPTRVAGT